LKELKDKEEMDFTTFVGKLKTREIKMKAKEEREPKKLVLHSKPPLDNTRRKVLPHQLSRRMMSKLKIKKMKISLSS